MKRPVLIVTANLELGDLIGKSLAETFQYDARHYRDPESAVAFLQAHGDCGHAIIEAAIGEKRILELGRALRTIKHNIKLVLISRSKPSRRLDEILPWSLLRQPFLLPDMLALLDAAAPTIIDLESLPAASAPTLTWLDDRLTAAKTLEGLAASYKVQEVMLFRENDLWACAGSLSKSSVAEIKDLVLSNVDSDQQFDLLRYMRLRNMDHQHGLWAKLLLVNVILAVIYDLDTPFGEMRKQTNAVADALARPVLADYGGEALLALPDENHLLRPGRHAKRPRGASRSSSQLSFLNSLESREDYYETEQRDPRLERPALPMAGSDTEEETDAPVGFAAPRRRRRGSPSRYSTSHTDDSETENADLPDFVDRHENLAGRDTAPANVQGLAYSCLLTPRFESHRLTGDLAEILRGALPQVCIAYGWRLEFMEVVPDCLHWVAVVPPTEAIANHVERVRRMTSGSIFDEFPEYLRQNFSKDFWAPGYAVMAGSDRHTPEQIRSYVLTYRERASGVQARPPRDGRNRDSGFNRSSGTFLDD